eukprot:Skav230007  [mRNA]  locus=scaffold1958:121594:125760:- [translate_table: standard]
MASITRDAWHALSKIRNSCEVVTTGDSKSWSGQAYLQLELVTPWGPSVECWVLDIGVPSTLHNLDRNETRRVCKVHVHVPEAPYWTIQPGDRIACRARLSASGEDRYAFVAAPLHVWHMGKLVSNSAFTFVHTFSGAFNGWSQALQQVEALLPQCEVKSSISVEYMPDACMINAKNDKAKVLNFPFKGITAPLPKHVVICCACEKEEWLSAIHDPTNLTWSASFPCPPFSRGNKAQQGVNCAEGRMLIHIFRHARIVQPIALLLENVDTFASHGHFQLFMKFAAWAGYQVQWQQVQDMADFAPYHRRRWLACLIRKDIAKDAKHGIIEVQDMKPVKWSEPMYRFATPPSLHEQRVITKELEASYANPLLLPKAKQQSLPVSATPFQVLQSRVVKSWEVLPTLVASYSSQHLLPSKTIWENGIYAELATDDFQRFVFQCPIMWASLLGTCKNLILPKDVHCIFKMLGNCITLAHATMGIIVMLQQLAVIEDEQPQKLVLAIWEKRLTAFNAVCVECQDGFLLTDFEHYVNHLWIPNPVAHVEEVSVDVVLTLPNRHTVRIQCIRGMSVIAMLKMLKVPPHIEHLWAIRDDQAQTTICQYDPITCNIQGHVVFLPFVNQPVGCPPTPEWTPPDATHDAPGAATIEGPTPEVPEIQAIANGESNQRSPTHSNQVVGNTAIDGESQEVPEVIHGTTQVQMIAIKVVMSQTDVFSQVRQEQGARSHTEDNSNLRSGPMADATISRDIECLPIRTIGEAVILAGHPQNLDTIQVTCEGEEVDIDELVTTVQNKTIQVAPKPPCQVTPKQRIVEVIKIDGTTSFFQLKETLTIHDLLCIAGMPPALVAVVRIEVNNRMIPFTTKIHDLDIPCIRLRAFPLKGGGGSSKGKGKGGSDPMQTDDPWAKPPPMAPSRSATRWDQLLLLDDHPFFDAETDDRLKQLPFVKIGPEQSGVAFATKASLGQIAENPPKGTTVVLLPGFKGITGEHIPVGSKVLPQQQIIVMEPGTNVQYKRLVVPVLLKGTVNFKIKEAPGMVTVQSSKFAEVVAELNENLISSAVKTHLGENPLDCFRKFIAQTGQNMADVAVYSYRMVKMHDLTWTHQCIVKVPMTSLDHLLTSSGSNEMFTRKFLVQDEQCDHSILPRYWQPVHEEIRAARQLGETLKPDYRGLAFTNKGVAIRITNSAISTGRAVVLQADNRFTEDNRATVCNHYYLAQGFRFDMNHEAIIKSTLQALQCAPVPMRSFRIGGMLTWVLAFQTPPTKMMFSVKVDSEVCEVVLTPQPANPNKTKHAKKLIKQSNPRTPKPGTTATVTTSVASAPMASMDEKRMQALEARVGSLESRQDELTTKVDHGFASVSSQLQQLLAAVVPKADAPKNKANQGTGETPPPKHAKAN